MAVPPSTSSSRIGYAAGSHGTATVRGNGSTWTAEDFFEVGFSGSGELTIAGGGTVTARQSFIGFLDYAEGTATITGEGSNWTTTGSGNFSFLSVGYEATGELFIENGGSANSAAGYIGHFDGAQGSATITGAGSVWTATGNLTLGGNSVGPTTAVGTLTLNDGGKVEVGGTLQLYANGTLTGSGGMVDGNVKNSGEVAPGNSPGVLPIAGDYEQTANGELTMQLAGVNPGMEYDQLLIQGNATLDGLLEVKLIDDFLPAAGDSFDILSWLDFTGSFDVDLPPIDVNLFWNTDLLYSDGILLVDSTVQPGDHNSDDVVDAADYVMWRKTDGGNSQGYTDWRENFGKGMGAGGGSAGTSPSGLGAPSRQRGCY